MVEALITVVHDRARDMLAARPGPLVSADRIVLKGPIPGTLTVSGTKREVLRTGSYPRPLTPSARRSRDLLADPS
jgi:hypothetical protein